MAGVDEGVPVDQESSQIETVESVPEMRFEDVAGAENEPIALHINVAGDPESLQMGVSDLPVGASLADGRNVFVASAGNNSVDVSDWSIGTLAVVAALDGRLRMETQRRSSLPRFK